MIAWFKKLMTESGFPCPSRTPITDAFEVWWSQNQKQCENLGSKLDLKAAVEYGYFSGFLAGTGDGK